MGRLVVIFASFFGGAVADGRYDQQANFSFLSSSLPVDFGQFLITHLSITPAVKDDNLLPAPSARASPRLFGGELVFAIETASFAGSPLAQDNVFAAAHHQGHILLRPIFLENGAI